MDRLLRIIGAFIISLAVYLIIVRSIAIEELIIGAVISLIVSIIISNTFPYSLKYLNPIRIFWFIIYIPFFLFKMIIANIEIALIVLNPSLPVKPGIVKGRTNIKSPLGKLILTSSITLTPGTLSADIYDDIIEIHLVRKENKSCEDIMRPFEKFIERITE